MDKSFFTNVFTIGNFRFLHSSHLGVTCHSPSAAKQRGLTQTGQWTEAFSLQPIRMEELAALKVLKMSFKPSDRDAH
jgi:hypothetical protein